MVCQSRETLSFNGRFFKRKGMDGSLTRLGSLKYHYNDSCQQIAMNISLSLSLLNSFYVADTKRQRNFMKTKLFIMA